LLSFIRFGRVLSAIVILEENIACLLGIEIDKVVLVVSSEEVLQYFLRFLISLLLSLRV
jgi:hypothetical protein